MLMDRIKPKLSPLRYRAREKPRSPILVDFEIRNLGGTTSAFDTMHDEMKNAKAPGSLEEELLEARRENGRLRQELEYYKSLATEILHPVMSVTPFHVSRLYSDVRKFNAAIERANSQWLADRVD